MTLEKKGMFDGVLGKYFLPGIILQSVLIGGGYATGREIVEYGAKFGAYGWLSGLATFIGFAVVCILSFELIRLYRLYDFKSFMKEIAGPFYRLFDLVYLLFMVIIIAVMSSATGSVVEQMTGLNYWYGVTGITIVVGVLNFYGERIIEYFETWGTIALYAGYLLFSFVVISTHTGNISRVFAETDFSYTPDATLGFALWTGILYMAYNLVVLPASFFTIKRQTSRRQSVVSGIIAGLLMTIPWFLTYFAVMGFYPDKNVVGAPVPWFVMMQGSGAPSWLFVVFGIVMGWTLIETSTGIIHAMLERIDRGLEDSQRAPLSRRARGGLTLAILVFSVVLAKVGIIDLIAKGYNALAYAFIVLFLLPLLTVGVYKIHKRRQEEAAAVPEAAEEK